MPDFSQSYGQIPDELQTGDMVVFSEAASSGTLIKIFYRVILYLLVSLVNVIVYMI